MLSHNSQSSLGSVLLRIEYDVLTVDFTGLDRMQYCCSKASDYFQVLYVIAEKE